MGTGTKVLSFHAGGQVFDIGDQLDTVGTDINTELNLGARYQFDFTENLGVEADITYSPSNVDFVGPGLGPNDLDALYYTGNIVYNILPAADVIPYLTGGGGAITLFVDDETGDTGADTKFVGNFGAGLMIPVADRFAFRFDVRNYVYRLENLDESLSQELSFPEGFQETVNDLAMTGGISILF